MDHAFEVLGSVLLIDFSPLLVLLLNKLSAGPSWLTSMLPDSNIVVGHWSIGIVLSLIGVGVDDRMLVSGGVFLIDDSPFSLSISNLMLVMMMQFVSRCHSEY